MSEDYVTDRIMDLIRGISDWGTISSTDRLSWICIVMYDTDHKDQCLENLYEALKRELKYKYGSKYATL